MSCQDSNVYLVTSYSVMSVIYIHILVKRCQHVTFSHISQKWLINNSTFDDRNTKDTITRYLTNGWATMLSFHTDMSKIL